MVIVDEKSKDNVYVENNDTYNRPSKHLNYQYIFLCVRHGVEVGEGVSLCLCESKTLHSI
jgi:hypothetical protein